MEPLVLSPLNYLFVHTFNSGKYCLGVFDNGGAGAVALWLSAGAANVGAVEE